MKTKGKRVCKVCGTALSSGSEPCPVCVLRGALEPQTTLLLDFSSELHFEHYQVLKNEDGTPLELGRGAMGVTYKAMDVYLQRTVALKIINSQFIGDDAARRRFVREARAAASVRHPNVASVFHLGESSGNYFYAMEFVDGETLAKSIQRFGKLDSQLALEIVAQVSAGVVAIEKQHLVHRDIKASNIMLSWDEGRLEAVKIIDLGLAKGIADETISTAVGFIGTPGYASPEQFFGIQVDIRSDLYSLGITLWEMLSGKLPFKGSGTELMHQHQHAALPIDKLKDIPQPVVALLEVLLAKDPEQRFQNPAELQNALPKVREAIASGSHLSLRELRSVTGQTKEQSSKRKLAKRAVRWALAATLSAAGLLTAWSFFSIHWGANPRSVEAIPTKKSIAVLPFESLSSNKDETYFADGVQGEILNNLAKIAQLKVISRTSVMQYRADAKRDLRQIASALGVANVLEGTVRLEGNHVRVTTELIDAGNDSTVWADSYDRDLSDIFAIQSEVAQTIASKLTATLSPEEKKRIEGKPTDNLEAYDLYLRAKELILNTRAVVAENSAKPAREAIILLDQAVQVDPKFTLAYCLSALAHDLLYRLSEFTPERSALADAALNSALRLQPDLPEVRLAYAYHLYYVYRDYDRAREQLAIARVGLPNDVEAILLAAAMDRRQGNFGKAIQELKQAITRDPRNPVSISELALSLFFTRQFRAAEDAFNRAIDLSPDKPLLKFEKAYYVTFLRTGDATAARSALAELPISMADAYGVLSWRLYFALIDQDWQRAKEFIEKMKGGPDDVNFAFGKASVPVGCHSILLARFEVEQNGANSRFSETREQLNQKVQKSSGNAKLLSQLAVVDALLGYKESAIVEAKQAADMLPISRDALDGPNVAANAVAVYAWSAELDLAFETLSPLTKTPNGLYYGDLKLNPYLEPLRRDPRFDKLLGELAPHDLAYSSRQSHLACRGQHPTDAPAKTSISIRLSCLMGEWHNAA
jgi:serine/threonine protein kinase/Tfp pilus assembly protein PilF